MKSAELNPVASLTKIQSEDSRISFAIIFQMCLLITNYTIKYVFNVNNDTTRALISLIFMLIAGTLFIKNIPIVFKRIGKIFVGTYSLFISIFSLNMLVNQDSIDYIMDVGFWFFLICLPVALFYLAIKNKGIFLEMLIKSAYYQVAVGLIFLVATYFREPVYDMTFSYLMMVPIIILTYKIYKKFRIYDLFLVIIGSISIIAIGSRGPILSIIIVTILLIFIYMIENIHKVKTFIFSLCSICLIGTFALYFENLLIFLNKFLSRYGIPSRTLYILITDDVDVLSGRSPIYDLTMEKIVERPFIGYGIAGDRVFLNGTYPHNIFLEILAQFGIVIGISIISVFIIYWIYGMFFNDYKEERDISLIFFGIGMVGLMFSGSYITKSNFWIFMATCISSIHFNKRKFKSKTTYIKEIVYEKGIVK